MKKIISILLMTALVLSFAGCSVAGDSTIATVNGEEIKASSFNFYLTNIKQQLQTPQGEDSEEYWTKTMIEGKPVAQYAKDKSLDEAIKLTVIAQKSKELGLTLTEEEKTALNNQKAELIQQSGSKEKYEKMLEEYGLTDVTFVKMMESQTFQEKLTQQMDGEYTQEEIKNFYDNNMVNVKHILVMTVDESGVPLQAQVIAENKVKAEGALQRMKNGEDFDTVLSEVNQDPGLPPTGYTLSKYSNMVEPFLSVSLGLNVGDVSEIVETNYGYHIIKRFEHKGDEEKFTAAQTDIKTGLFGTKVDEWKNASVIDIKTEVLDKIKVGKE